MTTAAAPATSTPTAVYATTPASGNLPALEWSATLCDGHPVDHATAEAACAALGDGWRLPTADELLSLVDSSREAPNIDLATFPDAKSDWYWTSTINARSPTYACYVDFGYDADDYSPSEDAAGGYCLRAYDDACVRAVRSVASGQ